MKKALLSIAAALMLSPVSYGQLIEASVKGGICMNNIPSKFGHITNYSPDGRIGFGGAVSGTVGIGDIRVGVSISALKVSTRLLLSFDATTEQPLIHNLGNPLIPIEAIVLKRTRISKFSIDIGLLGGICLNSRYVNHYDDGRKTTSDAGNNWFTYGGTFGGQYAITKRLSAGLEAQMKWLRTSGGKTLDNTMLVPVMAKVAVAL